MVERRADAEFARLSGERQQFFEIGMSETDAHFLGGSHFHDLHNLGEHLPGFAHETDATAFWVSGSAPKAQRRERREPDHFEIWILQRDADRVRIHSQTRSRSAVDLDAMREFALLDEVIDMALCEECGVGAH